MHRIQILDSHTGGEPTRLVLSGGPDLGAGSLADRRERLRREYDEWRSAIVNEPRGSDVMVGALLCEPTDPNCVAGVIFFNNVGVLNMCGHGTIGVGVSLGHLGRITAGTHRLETPVGVVTIDYDGRHQVALENVPSYRSQKDVAVEVPGEGVVRGDIAWGGNWFFLIKDHKERVTFANLDRLTEFTCRVKQALFQQGISGEHGFEIDHIEVFGPPEAADADSKNFVLCPGRAYDRSPCGTGTSAKLACLFADGKLKPGDVWRQESIVGSVFEGSVRLDGDRILPRIAGTAYVTAEATLLLDPADPFRMGIRS